jgi:hypothetical protein
VRIYDFNGSAHIGSRDVGSGSLQIAEQKAASDTRPTIPRPPSGGPPRAPRPAVCSTGLSYDEPVEPIITALFARMDDWARTGKPMPHAARVTIAGGATVKDPATGIAEGGLRPPWIVAPAATYLVGDEVGCSANDVKTPYTAAMLKARYGDYAGYVHAFDAAKTLSIKDGFLLPQDRDDIQPTIDAKAFD